MLKSRNLNKDIEENLTDPNEKDPVFTRLDKILSKRLAMNCTIGESISIRVKDSGRAIKPVIVGVDIESMDKPVYFGKLHVKYFGNIPAHRLLSTPEMPRTSKSYELFPLFDLDTTPNHFIFYFYDSERH